MDRIVDSLYLYLDGGQPEGEFVGEVVAGAVRAVALDEGSGSEVLQTRSGTAQRLSSTASTGGSVLEKRNFSVLEIYWKTKFFS